MTNKERIMVRGYLNQFSDRWPFEYHDLYYEYRSANAFEIVVLSKLLRYAKLDRDTAMDVYDLIHKLERQETVNDFWETNEWKSGKHKIKVSIDEIDCGGEL